jgi:hypothetical protein
MRIEWVTFVVDSGQFRVSIGKCGLGLVYELSLKDLDFEKT